MMLSFSGDFFEKQNHALRNFKKCGMIRELRKRTGMTRKDFAMHIGIPLRTVEDWEAGRRRPPEYIPRLISYQLRYEELMKKMEEEADAGKE